MLSHQTKPPGPWSLHFQSSFSIYFISSYFILYMSLSILDVWFSLAHCALRYKTVKVAVKHAYFIRTIYKLLVTREGSQWNSQSFPTFPCLSEAGWCSCTPALAEPWVFLLATVFLFHSPPADVPTPPPPSLYNPKCLIPQHTLSPLYFRLSEL